jgi:hypothetical protein
MGNDVTKVRFANSVVSRQELNEALSQDEAYMSHIRTINKFKEEVSKTKEELKKLSDDQTKALPEEVACSKIERQLEATKEKLAKLREDRDVARRKALTARRKEQGKVKSKRSTLNIRLTRRNNQVREYYTYADERKAAVFKELMQLNKVKKLRKETDGE